MMPSDISMMSVYDWRLMALSVLIAVIASYTALDLAGRVTAAQGRARQAWLTGGAVTMGVSIWTMHFVAMSAFNLPISIAYHVPTALVAMLVAIAASGAALIVVSRRVMGTFQMLVGGVFLGLGIALMHYIGMAAMRLQAVARYDPILVTLSVMIAIAASLAALWLAFQLREDATAGGSWRKIGSALVMGGAIAGMHYTAMAAVTFTAAPVSEADRGQAIGISMLGAVAIAVAMFIVMSLALLTSLIDRRFAEALRKSEERFRSLYLIGQALVSNLELEPLLQNITDAARELLSARLSGLLVLGESAERYEYFKVSGWSHKPTFLPLPQDMEFFTIPFKEGTCLRVDDISKHSGSAAVSNGHPPVKAFLCVPLRFKDRTLGTLFVGKGPSDGVFTKDDEDLLVVYANEAAIALENAHLYDRQKKAVIRLRELSHDLSKAQEEWLLTEERNRIAQELHDQVAQDLFSIGLKANWCLERLEPTSEIEQAIRIIKRSAGQSTVHIRNAIYALSSQEEGAHRLINSLRSIVWEFREASGIDADLVIAGGIPRLSGHVEDALCGVAREGLANVAKHSRARVAVVSLRCTSQDVTLTIQDDGIGLPCLVMANYTGSVTHFGLNGMRRRIEALSGRFHLMNGEAAGLIVTTTVPLTGVLDEEDSSPARG